MPDNSILIGLVSSGGNIAPNKYGGILTIIKINLYRVQLKFNVDYSHGVVKEFTATYHGQNGLSSWGENYSEHNGVKTNLTENDSSKIFTAKGALDLFNKLTTLISDSVNTAKEALRIDISRKEDKFEKNDGFNLQKTDVPEDNSNKLFTAKGALNLKTRLDNQQIAYTYSNLAYFGYDSQNANLIDVIGKMVNSSILIAAVESGGNIGPFSLGGILQIIKNGTYRVSLKFYTDNAIAPREFIAYYHPNNGLSSWGENYTEHNGIKTDLVENSSVKIFTAKGALNLKNWLVENYTNLVSNSVSNLTNLVNSKVSHGGYGGTGLDLFNLIQTNRFRNLYTDMSQVGFDAKNIDLVELVTNRMTDYSILTAIIEPGHNLNIGFGIGTPGGTLQIIKLNSARIIIKYFVDSSSSTRIFIAGYHYVAGLTPFREVHTDQSPPVPVGSYFYTDNPTNPAQTYVGTTWRKINARFILGTNEGEASGLEGGNSSIQLQTGNLPRFRLTIPPHWHYICRTDSEGARMFDDNGGNSDAETNSSSRYSNTGVQWRTTTQEEQNTNYLGDGTPFSIIPPYRTTHIWLRVS